MEEKIRELEERVAALERRANGESEEQGFSLKDLLGMEVVGVGKGRCDGCLMEHYDADCCKVEMVGGDYLCLTKPQPEEEEDGDALADIREHAEAFLDYLDSVIVG